MSAIGPGVFSPPGMELKYYPWLPFELVETIVAEAWFLPLTAEERITFMTSAPLVSKTWMHIFFRISLQHVHIPCQSYLNRYFALLYGNTNCAEVNILPSGAGAAHLCQSFNIIIDGTPAVNLHPRLPAHIFHCLYLLRTATHDLPRLDTLSITFLNTEADETMLTLFDALDFSSLPSQITHLELSLGTSPWTISTLCCHPSRRGRLSWSLPDIQHLSILGTTSDVIVADMVSGCPNLTALRIDPSACLDVYCLCACPLVLRKSIQPPGIRLSVMLRSLAHTHDAVDTQWDGIRADGMAVFHRVSELS